MNSNRVEKLNALLSENGLDGALITSVENIRYISGFTSSDAVLLVTKDERLLFTDFRYYIQAREQAPDFTLVEITYDNLNSKIEEALVRSGVKRCAFEEEKVSVAEFEGYKKMPAEFVPFGSDITALRLIKDAEEIECLKVAQRMADAAYKEFLTRVHPGMTELECVAELNYACAKQGSEGPSFDPIVGSGPNGAMCHAVPGERRLQAGDLVVVDFGCIYHGYHSDMTRTFGVVDVSDEMKKIYAITLDAQLKALEALKEGITGKELDAIARDHIASFGYGKDFGHSLGHGFGLEIHEAPRASTGSKDTLLEGMTITVEPGIYLEGKGGVRIEDCCVVTKEGKINLVCSPKELQLIS